MHELKVPCWPTALDIGIRCQFSFQEVHKIVPAFHVDNERNRNSLCFNLYELYPLGIGSSRITKRTWYELC